MLLDLKLISFVHKIVNQKWWINQWLVNYRIDTIGDHKELVLIYRFSEKRIICFLNHIIKYEQAFIRIEYKQSETCVYFMVPDRFFYSMNFMQSRCISSFTDDELFEIENFYNTKSPDYHYDSSGYFYLDFFRLDFFRLDFFFLEAFSY